MALEDLLKGPLPSIVGKYKGRRLIIAADAACVWDDLERFGCRVNTGRGSVRKDGWDVMTINKVVETFPGNIEHVYSNEPALLHSFIAARRAEYANEFSLIGHAHSCNKGAQWRWPWTGRGSSLLGGAVVGLGLGYEQIVICGGPLDDGPHNGEPHWRKCAFIKREVPDGSATIENEHWREAIRLALKGRVTSMSGRTMAWLGAPTS